MAGTTLCFNVGTCHLTTQTQLQTQRGSTTQSPSATGESASQENTTSTTEPSTTGTSTSSSAAAVAPAPPTSPPAASTPHVSSVDTQSSASGAVSKLGSGVNPTVSAKGTDAGTPSAQTLADQSTDTTGSNPPHASIPFTAGPEFPPNTNVPFAPDAAPSSSAASLPGAYHPPAVAPTGTSTNAHTHPTPLGAIIGGALGGLALLLLLVVAGIALHRRMRRARMAPSAEFVGIARGTTPMPLPLARPSGGFGSGSGRGLGAGAGGSTTPSSGARLVPLARQRSRSFEGEGEGESVAHGYEDDEFWSAEGGEEETEEGGHLAPPPPFTPGMFADPLFDKVFEATTMREHYARQERESWPGYGLDSKKLEDPWEEEAEKGEQDGEKEDVTMRSEESTIVAFDEEDDVGSKEGYGWAI
ncbi:hypothetical protein C2E23DRAFT_894274 [Lenzites betulinus]|nr:hypothetical protein C2E23DRAFT_894274 [Lenzites betulinus]